VEEGTGNLGSRRSGWRASLSAEGLYVGRNGAETILVEEKSRAVVWDWEADNVPASLATVLRTHGRLWTPEPVESVST